MTRLRLNLKESSPIKMSMIVRIVRIVAVVVSIGLLHYGQPQASELPSHSSVKEHPSNSHKAAMELLAGTRGKIESLRTLRAKIVQQKSLSMLLSPVVSEGEFLYKKGAKFVWHYLPPDESVTVSDGSRVWLYYPAFSRAELYDLKRFKKKSRLFDKLCLGFERPLCDLSDSFFIDLICSDESTFEVSLKPKDEGMGRLIREFYIRIDRVTGLPVQFRSFEKGGDETTISLHDVKVNEPLDDKLFVFVPPPGVVVVEAQGSLSY